MITFVGSIQRGLLLIALVTSRLPGLSVADMRDTDLAANKSNSGKTTNNAMETRNAMTK